MALTTFLLVVGFIVTSFAWNITQSKGSRRKRIVGVLVLAVAFLAIPEILRHLR